MSAVAFLLDQHIDPAVATAVLTEEPTIVVKMVGEPDAPALGTKDPGLLQYAEMNSLAIVTFDKRSMPSHIADHLRSGRHTWGVFIFPNSSISPGRIASELILVWGASTAEEWIDQSPFCPI